MDALAPSGVPAKPLQDADDDGGFSGDSLDRSALQQPIDEVRARRVDVVVYKVDRLTRSLSDFAQLEREVTAEGIRDKVAASKRKGMRVGGPVPRAHYPPNRRRIPPRR